MRCAELKTKASLERFCRRQASSHRCLFIIMRCQKRFLFIFRYATLRRQMSRAEELQSSRSKTNADPKEVIQQQRRNESISLIQMRRFPMDCNGAEHSGLPSVFRSFVCSFDRSLICSILRSSRKVHQKHLTNDYQAQIPQPLGDYYSQRFKVSSFSRYTGTRVGCVAS